MSLHHCESCPEGCRWPLWWDVGVRGGERRGQHGIEIGVDAARALLSRKA